MKHKLKHQMLKIKKIVTESDYQTILPYQIRQKPLSAPAFEAHLNLPTWSFILKWIVIFLYNISMLKNTF